MDREKAIEELKRVNNSLSLLMKEKKALQTYIQEENDRLKNINSNKTKALELKYDKDFIKEYGRERTVPEIALIMNYSVRQVQRFLEKEKD